MNRNIVKVVLIRAAFTVAFLRPAVAQGVQGAEPQSSGQHKDRMERMTKQLNLSAEQQEKIRAYRQQHREQQQALRQQIRQKRQELQTELEKAEADQARVQAIGAELKNLMGRQIDNRVQGILTMKSILTPEQFAEFQKKAQEFRRGQHGGDRKSGWMKKKGGRKGAWTDKMDDQD